MLEARLYLLQRASAMLLAPLVLVHLGLILYAVEGGLSAGEILGRTKGNLFWAGFYGLFVLAASLHAPIGLRNILREWTRWRGRSLDLATGGFALLLLALGLRAIWAVTA
ncbi:succinate dehydrogenase [Nisaea acidiphila]|uniref:Succinate dehydrogenase n=1 Tax=Nisaea acidiphila TaxID=1862145 RepID=A0A9J7AKM9_9PROT|nr:succinate dehydrogenase [Nisaea acidiphila]UUX48211.1 succinate dehydrogenase [Nisaea acidiphila]